MPAALLFAGSRLAVFLPPFPVFFFRVKKLSYIGNTLANAPEHLGDMMDFKSGIFVESKSGKNPSAHPIPKQLARPRA